MSYPYVRIRAFGVVSGRKSLSHMSGLFFDFQDPNAWPASPVTAMILESIASNQRHGPDI